MADLKATLCGELPQNEFYFLQNTFNLIRFWERERGSCWVAGVEDQAAKRAGQHEADAWLDLWCHTVWQDPGNAFSHIAPAVQYGKYGAACPFRKAALEASRAQAPMIPFPAGV